MSASETHPRFPSGDWEGFYTYRTNGGGQRHRKRCVLHFSDGMVTGHGTDDIGAFSWQGTYDTEALTCSLTKTYPTHEVAYQGQVDENGIWGTWSIGLWSGGFHLWPVEKEEEETAAEETEEVIVDVG